ncbi:hypothetical protein BS47DRAFT_1343980 [Hydnum rufescens UP504]|uniref:Uncharacterized protein n=1 Tax=Hydnum rufescens UP504 TaxID=1448309 RepID=A0A9P6AXJ9_9AGAM|nr:hypothetical protein BS47DRAFT_1343980 [Hydnum rufescens UP504]
MITTEGNDFQTWVSIDAICPPSVSTGTRFRPPTTLPDLGKGAFSAIIIFIMFSKHVQDVLS